MKYTTIALQLAATQAATSIGCDVPTNQHICNSAENINECTDINQNYQTAGCFVDEGSNDIVHKDNDVTTNVRKYTNTATYRDICRDNSQIGPNVVKRVNDVNHNFARNINNQSVLPIYNGWGYGGYGGCGGYGGYGGYGRYGGYGGCGGSYGGYGLGGWGGYGLGGWGGYGGYGSGFGGCGRYGYFGGFGGFGRGCGGYGYY